MLHIVYHVLNLSVNLQVLYPLPLRWDGLSFLLIWNEGNLCSIVLKFLIGSYVD